jgi:DnaJ-class molecular chaperone
MSYYDCLGIAKTASQDEIKKAFRKKSLLCHPDKPTGDAEKFKKINEAYQTLGDEHKKKIYDMQQNGGIPNRSHGNGFNQGFGHPNMNDVMSMFFQNGFPNNMPQPNINKQTNPNSRFKVFYNGTPIQRKPPVIIQRVTITLEQSYSGGVIPLEINRWIDVDSVKTMEKENIYVKFPKGIDNNEMILLKEKGHNFNASQQGDVKVIFTVKNDTPFIRKGVDLVYNKTISLKEALTGLEMNIDHINGKKYKVDTVNNYCIINNNSNTSLPNLGMTRENVTGKLIINFKVEFPKEISAENREKLKECL